MADSQTIDPLFALLIERTQVLVTVCDNAATVLSAEFESMITEPMMAVKQVLDMCPTLHPWDGSFREEDISVEVFRHEAQRPDVPPASVRVTHVPSGMSVESYSKSTHEENEAVARRALADRVRDRWAAQQQPPQGTAMGPRPSRDGQRF